MVYSVDGLDESLVITKDGTYIKCDYAEGCVFQIKNNKWAKIKATDWFLGHDKQFCPVHQPAWRKR